MLINFYRQYCGREKVLIHFFLSLFFTFFFATALLAQTYKILPLGNSITEGKPEDPGYRYYLYEQLTKAHINFNYVGSNTSAPREGQTPANCLGERISIPTLSHEGHGGWRSDHILNGKPYSDPGYLAQWLQGYTPDIVLMHVGTNDMFQNRSVSRTIGELREIVRVLRVDNPNVTILMAKLIPADPATVGTTEANNITLLNNQIPALVQELHTSQSPVVLVDQNTGFDPTPGADTFDGIHTTKSGSIKMADKWFGALRDILSSYTQAPIVSISTPAAGTGHSSGQAIKVGATATDPEGAVSLVEFFANCTKIGEDATSPYEISWTPTNTGDVNLRARVTDAAGAKGISSPVKVSITGTSNPTPICSATGTIVREQWNNVRGSSVADIPVSQSPSSTSKLSLFEAPRNLGDYYGARIRGYICVPQTGAYTFYIASDDHSELWLSTDDNQANKRKIASVTGYTYPRDWDKYPSQTSVAIQLEAGKRYYIEALHLQGKGGDNLAVGWKLPNGTTEAPIPGSRLSPYEATGTPAKQNQTITFAALPDKLKSDPPFTINASATSDLPVSFAVVSGPATLSGNTVTLSGSTGTVRIRATQAGNESYNAATPIEQSFAVTEKTTTPPSTCSATGTIVREQWSNVEGFSVADIPLSQPPSNTAQLTIFEAPRNIAYHYGARIRGYICVPQTGAYTFYIASDDNSELWLSTDDNPANKRKIASVTGYTYARQWNKFTSQTSAAIQLEAGKRYYIEALHKQGTGGDNLAVGWKLPDGTTEAPIPGSRLSPYQSSSTAKSITTTTASQQAQTSTAVEQVAVYPNPFSSSLTIKLTKALGEMQYVSIVNLAGKVVYTTTLAPDQDRLELSVSELKQGLYLLQLRNSNGHQQNFKLLKQ